MIIGVDIDGVLTEIIKYIDKKFPEFVKNNNVNVHKNDKSENLYQYMGITSQEEDDFWAEYVWNYSETCKMKRNANKILKKLHDDGHKILIVTKRRCATMNNSKGKAMQDSVRLWLKNHDIYYDDLFFIPEDGNKYNVCKANDIEIFIDDDVKNLRDISKFIPAICFDGKANQEFSGKNIIRCKNWKQIYKVIKKKNEFI